MRFTPSLKSFPNVAFETVPVLSVLGGGQSLMSWVVVYEVSIFDVWRI